FPPDSGPLPLLHWTRIGSGSVTARRGSQSLTASDREVVAALGQAIVQRVGEPRYQLWFEGHTKYTWEDGLLRIGVPNRHLQEYLQSRFTEMLRAAACEVFGRTTEVRFTIDPELFQAARREQEVSRIANPAYGEAD